MPAQEDQTLCEEFATRLGLEGKERDSFISSSMKRLGYTARTAWDDPEPEGDGEDEDEQDFFTSRRKKGGPEKRTVGPKKRAVGGNWQYAEDDGEE